MKQLALIVTMALFGTSAMATTVTTSEAVKPEVKTEKAEPVKKEVKKAKSKKVKKEEVKK